MLTRARPTPRASAVGAWDLHQGVHGVAATMGGVDRTTQTPAMQRESNIDGTRL